MGVMSLIGHTGRSVVVGVLALGSAAPLQAQVGLASGAAHITLIARVVPGASVVEVAPAPGTARRGGSKDKTVGIRLSANTSYRLMVVGTAPERSQAEPARRLWVRAENGRFEEVRSGAAVTVVRGRRAVAEWEAEVSFRSETSASGHDTDVLPVRYEIRVEPAI